MLKSFVNENGVQTVETVGKVVEMGKNNLYNVKGTAYRLATVEINLNGYNKKHTAAIWETGLLNFVNKTKAEKEANGEKSDNITPENVMLNKQFVVYMENIDGQVYVKLTPMVRTQNEKVSVEDFNMLFDSATPRETVNNTVNKSLDANDIF